MSRILFLACLALLFVASFSLSVEKRGELESETEGESFTVSGTETYADAEGPDSLGAGDLEKGAIAEETVKTAVRSGRRLTTAKNAEFASTHAAAGTALSAAAEAHRALSAHHASIRSAKEALKALQVKTAGLTAKAAQLTKAATSASVSSDALAAELKPVDAAAPVAVDASRPKVGAACTNSAGSWVNQFPTSSSTDSLAEPFKTNTNNFINALKAAGASVSIAATYRPAERAYMMHWSYKIANGIVNAKNVPAMAGVNICWNHASAQSAARAMVAGFSIAYAPALNSRHTERKAIDMNISWSRSITLKGITCPPGTGAGSACMHRIGKAYGLIKLVSDPPHWSTDGR